MAPRLQLFGTFRLHEGDGRPVPVSAARLQSLLGWTALTPGPHDRGRLAEHFWPGLADAQGRNNLRQVLHQLRRTWPSHSRYIHADEGTVSWLVPVQVDVADFAREFTRAQDAWQRGDRVAAKSALTSALAHYDGPLLPACSDAWIEQRREQLHRQALQALDLLARLHEERRELREAIGAAERMVALDPLEERSSLRLMRLLALEGDRAGALRVYEALARALRQELDAPPTAEVQDAARRIGARRASPGGPGVEDSPRPGPIVGREAEWRRLLAAWQRAERGEPGFTLIVGEAGVGKSRLAEELLTWADAQGLATARARAYEAEGRLALAPVAEWLRAAPIRPSLDRLEAPWRAECARLLPELLAAEPGLPAPDPLTDYRQRQRFFDGLVRAVTHASPSLLLVLDDLQWCDADTLEWLHYLLRTGTPRRCLVVGTARDDEADVNHPLTRLRTTLRSAGQLEEITLDPLDAAETARLASSVSGRALDTGQALRLYHDTRGNPLFIVETMRAGGVPGVEQADTGAAPVLPPRVQAVITGRLHQLSADARELAGAAAAIGRAFDIDLLAEASGFDEARAARALDELWHRKIVREADPGPEAGAYDFSHDRLRDVAYATLGPAQRRRWHLRVADCLERRAAGDPELVAAQVAAHYDRGGQPARALRHYEIAARAAQRLFAYRESRALLDRLVALVPYEPDRREAASIELRAQLMIASAIRVTSGWAFPDLEPVHARVVALSLEVGTPEQRAAALAAAVFFSEVRAEYARVATLVGDMRRAVAESDSPSLKVMAATATLGYYGLRGELAAAEATFNESSSWYDTAQHASHVALTGADFGVLQRAWSSHAAWALGDSAGAFARVNDALRLARDLSHPFSEALALTYLATLHQLAGDVDSCEAVTREALEVSNRSRVIYYAAWSGILLAWVEAARQPSEASAARVHERIDAFLATGAGARLSYYLSLAADARRRAGDVRGALGDLDRAIEVSGRQGDLWFDAELHRARAEVLAELGRADDAIEAAARAVSVARSQRASVFEARAAATTASLAANARANG